MLAEKYKNALEALKAQSTGRLNNLKRLSQDCEAEAGHIYRIMHAHNTNIDEITEELLHRFMNEEIASGSPYPPPDRDGLQYVDLDKNVLVYPSIMKGCLSEPIVGQSYTLIAHEVRAMLSQLAEMGKLSLITTSIQSLYESEDGTQFQTAFPELTDVMNCINSGLNLPEAFVDKIKEWELLGASEVNFDFVELKI